MKLKLWFLTIVSGLFIGIVRAESAGPVINEVFDADIHNQQSLQRGMKYFVNYCMGCHSLKYQRYNRAFKDLGIDTKVGEENLIFTGAKVAEQMHNAIKPEQAEKWFGKAPPDLSLTARAKSGRYIYNYLLSFYLDNTRPLGFNNLVFPGASMPNPLWKLQGLQTPDYAEEKNSEGETVKTIKGLTLTQPGQLSPEEYRQVSYDLANFLTYVSDPSALARSSIGPWALFFIVLLAVLFYILKREYWRDVH